MQDSDGFPGGFWGECHREQVKWAAALSKPVAIFAIAVAFSLASAGRRPCLAGEPPLDIAALAAAASPEPSVDAAPHKLKRSDLEVLYQRIRWLLAGNGAGRDAICLIGREGTGLNRCSGNIPKWNQLVDSLTESSDRVPATHR